MCNELNKILSKYVKIFILSNILISIGRDYLFTYCNNMTGLNNLECNVINSTYAYLSHIYLAGLPKTALGK